MFLPIFFVCLTQTVADKPQTECKFMPFAVVQSESMCHSVMRTGQEALLKQKELLPGLSWNGQCLKLEKGNEV